MDFGLQINYKKAPTMGTKSVSSFSRGFQVPFGCSKSPKALKLFPKGSPVGGRLERIRKSKRKTSSTRPHGFDFWGPCKSLWTHEIPTSPFFFEETWARAPKLLLVVLMEGVYGTPINGRKFKWVSLGVIIYFYKWSDYIPTYNW